MEKMNLKTWRTMRGYTQQHVAERLGISAMSVSKMERSHKITSSIRKYLTILEIEPEQVLFEKKEK